MLLSRVWYGVGGIHSKGSQGLKFKFERCVIREIRAYKAKKESEFKECMKVVKKLVEEAEKTT